MSDVAEYIATFRCPDKPGIMARISGRLFELGCDIRDAGVYGDPETQQFFIRMHLASPSAPQEDIETTLEGLAADLKLTWTLTNTAERMKVLIAVSKFDHCLRDVLHKWRIGGLPIDIVGVMSNHPDLKPIVDWHKLPFHHLPITPDTKAEQEGQFKRLIAGSGAELVVLARYMQILSDEFAADLSGRCINIHHSFLPSFKGARPYHQAHGRGVKLIGATAHYVTADLDEGPIIEQDVRRVTHATTANDMVAIGREVEASVLSRAVRWHAEHRVFLNGNRTVVLN